MVRGHDISEHPQTFDSGQPVTRPARALARDGGDRERGSLRLYVQAPARFHRSWRAALGNNADDIVIHEFS